MDDPTEKEERLVKIPVETARANSLLTQTMGPDVQGMIGPAVAVGVFHMLCR